MALTVGMEVEYRGKKATVTKLDVPYTDYGGAPHSDGVLLNARSYSGSSHEIRLQEKHVKRLRSWDKAQALETRAKELQQGIKILSESFPGRYDLSGEVWVAKMDRNKPCVKLELTETAFYLLLERLGQEEDPLDDLIGDESA